MENKAVDQFIGKTLKDVRAMQSPSPVRVVKAGKVGFVHTMEYRPNRLNVTLSEEGLKFYTETATINGKEHTFDRVDGSMDLGVVIAARWG